MVKHKPEQQQVFTAEQLEKMINDYIDYWSDPLGKGDLDVIAADALPKQALPIARQLLAMLKSKQ